MFSSNKDSLGCQSFKGASWALVLGLHLRDTIKGLLPALGPFLIPTFGHVSWSCAPIISNLISNYKIYIESYFTYLDIEYDSPISSFKFFTFFSVSYLRKTKIKRQNKN